MPNVSVGPLNKRSTHTLRLSMDGEEIGLELDGGVRGLREIPQTPSTLLFSQGGSKFGDFEPGYSHIESRTWVGGRGQYEFSEDPSRFFDSQNLCSWIDQRLLPAPQWKFATGLRSEDRNLPGNVAWKKLLGAKLYASASFSASASYNADKAYLWIRRLGSPGTLTVELRSNSAGDPSSVLKSATVTTTTITDVVSVFQVFDWTTTQALVSGTTYHIVIYGATTDNNANHWEVGADVSGTGKISSAGSSWAASTFKIYYRIVDADTKRQFYFFLLRGALYAVSRLDAGTASKLYLNGARGLATAGAATTLTDGGASWTTNVFTNARVRIIAGTGDGQDRAISSNTGTVLTVDTAWDVNPDTTSEYIVYATSFWSEVTGTGITGVVRSVAVNNGIVYFAQGSAANIRRMRFVAGTGHQYADDGVNRCDLLTVFNSPDSGVQIWGGTISTSTLIYAAAVAWGVNLTFSATIPVGGTDFNITKLIPYNDQLWVIKEDSLWSVRNNKARPLEVGLNAMPERTNGIAACTQNLYLMFGWSSSIERFYGSTLDDMGPWKAAGLPTGRRGVVMSLEPVLAWIFAAVDASTTGTSSLLLYNGMGYHEVFRAWEVGQRIRNVKWQPCPGGRPRLWNDCGGDLVYQDFPYATINPEQDSTLPYQHEAVLVTSTFDLASSQLPKFFKELTASTVNLTTGVEIRFEYQLDNDIGSANWTNAGIFYQSPEDVTPIMEGNRRAIRLRIRILTNTATTPPIVRALVLEAFARTPVKYQYVLRVRVRARGRTKTGQQDFRPDQVTNFLKLAARSAGKIYMRSTLAQLDDKFVLVEPPTVLRSAANSFLGWMNGTLDLVVRDV